MSKWNLKQTVEHKIFGDEINKVSFAYPAAVYEV